MTEQTFDIFANGQYRENYGSHDWDGVGECPQYWKCKGDDRVLVTPNVTLAELPEALKAAEVRAAAGEFNHSDDFWSRDCSYVEYFPHAANAATMYGIEFGIDAARMENGTEADIALARWFCNFIGKPFDEEEAA